MVTSAALGGLAKVYSAVIELSFLPLSWFGILHGIRPNFQRYSREFNSHVKLNQLCTFSVPCSYGALARRFHAVFFLVKLSQERCRLVPVRVRLHP